MQAKRNHRLDKGYNQLESNWKKAKEADLKSA